MVDGVVDVAHTEAVGGLVPLGVQVAGRLLLAHAEDELVDHVELHILRLGALVGDAYLVVLLCFVAGHEDTHGDAEGVVVGVEGRPALAVARGGGDELAAVDEEHLAGVVAHDVVAPARELELLRVVGESEARHGGTDDTAEVVLVGDDIVGDHIVAPVVVEAAVLVIVAQVAPHAELLARFEHRVFYLVLVVLVGHLEAAQLLRYGDAVGGGEGETRHGAEQYALGLGDVAAVEHIDTPGIAVLGP